MVLFVFAHIFDNASSSWSLGHTVALIVVAGLCALVIENSFVRYGEVRIRQLRKPTAALLAVALAAVLAPTPGFAQSATVPSGLPDLVSDPAFIWIERDLYDAEDNIVHVLTFDGFLHNIGDGALDLAGNPQEPGGVKQRVWDGENWTEVGTPNVRFENDDGHNHFHLINAAAYTLWNEAQTEQVTIGSKIGFCLLDTAQVEERYDASYNIDEINYCGINDPDTTNLRMGITPGWHDVYEASIRLQWVDVSNTPPGRYWVGAEIDPNNEIVESNEDNNGNVFSRNKYAVSGYVGHDLAVTDLSDITLRSSVFGTVGARAFVIVDPPEHGTLSVPPGFDLLSDTVQYMPDADFVGSDSFTYYAHDTNTPFPIDPIMATVEIAVTDAFDPVDEADNPGFGEDAEIVSSTVNISATRYDPVEVPLTLQGSLVPGDVTWHAQGLPAGVTIDQTSGLISGELTIPTETTSSITAVAGQTSVSISIDWKVQDGPIASLRPVNDMSTVQERRDIVLGEGTAETTYEATGLPEGTIVTEGQPNLLGTPSESGDFDITVNELLDGEIVDTMQFTLTVRNTTRPAFPL